MPKTAEGNPDPFLQESLQRFVKEQRVTCEELNELIEEFQALLQQFAARENLLFLLDEPVESIAPDGSTHDPVSVHELVLRDSREAIARTQALRAKSRRLRGAVAGKQAKALLERTADAAKDGQSLSKRELEVLQLMVQGKSSKEIAAALSISFKTAVTHRSSIMSKMDVHEVASVVREAILRGWV